MVEQWSPKPQVKGSNPFSPDPETLLHSSGGSSQPKKCLDPTPFSVMAEALPYIQLELQSEISNSRKQKRVSYWLF